MLRARPEGGESALQNPIYSDILKRIYNPYSRLQTTRMYCYYDTLYLDQPDGAWIFPQLFFACMNVRIRIVPRGVTVALCTHLHRQLPQTANSYT